MAIGRIGAAKIALFIVALVPLARLVAGALVWQEWLGANPAEFIVRSTGDWTLRILLATLAVTPLRRWTGWHWRRTFHCSPCRTERLDTPPQRPLP